MLICPQCDAWFEFGVPLSQCIYCKVSLKEEFLAETKIIDFIVTPIEKTKD